MDQPLANLLLLLLLLLLLSFSFIQNYDIVLLKHLSSHLIDWVSEWPTVKRMLMTCLAMYANNVTIRFLQDDRLPAMIA